MHIAVVTRHLGRAVLYYGPTLRALIDEDTELTLHGPSGTEIGTGERAPWRVRHIALRPRGATPAPLEWAVLAGDLISRSEGHTSLDDTVDVLMTFEEDLEPVVTMAARAVRARLVVSAAAVAPEPSVSQRARAQIAPLWRRVQNLVSPAVRAQAQERARAVGETARAQVRALAQKAQELPMWTQLPQPVRSAHAPTAQMWMHAAEQLRQYVAPPLVHYLLTDAPSGWDAPAGWTDFGFGVGVDVDRFLVGGQGRTPADLEGKRMRVGVFTDPTGSGARREAISREAQRAVSNLDGEAVSWRGWPTPRPGESLERTCRKYLHTLDVAIVPGDDFYAAMQAAAAGCVVVTHVDSPAASTFRDGESGYGVEAFDHVQLHMILKQLTDSTLRARMQDSAQRRALRLFDYVLFVRRLARGVDRHLQVGDGPSDPSQVERSVRRHV